jgi:hypothetical protein
MHLQFLHLDNQCDIAAGSRSTVFRSTIKGAQLIEALSPGHVTVPRDSNLSEFLHNSTDRTKQSRVFLVKNSNQLRKSLELRTTHSFSQSVVHTEWDSVVDCQSVDYIKEVFTLTVVHASSSIKL